MQDNYDNISLYQYLSEIGKTSLITREREYELGKRIKRGDLRALDELVKANMRFVVNISKHYNYTGIPLTDLIGYGNLGLIKAAQRFDETKGFKFISYAVWWIRQAILEGVEHYQTIVRLPSNKRIELSKLVESTKILEQENMREPSIEELAEDTKLEPDEVDVLIKSSIEPLYLDDTPYNDERDFYDITEDQGQESPEDYVNSLQLKERIDLALSTLERREAEFLKLYFGLDGCEGHTLEQIGMRFGLSRERVRQIKYNALKKLKHPTRRRIFEPMLR